MHAGKVTATEGLHLWHTCARLSWNILSKVALTCSHAAVVVQMCIAPAAALCFRLSPPAALASLLPVA